MNSSTTTLNGKVAIITGGGQGIGRAIAARFLEAGARVVLAEADKAAGRDALEELKAKGEVVFIPTDVAREKQVSDVIRRAAERWGRLDILVNNAAIARNKPLADLSLEEWNATLAVNLTGPLLCAKYAAPHLKANRGAIVNIASTRAFMSEPNTEAYSASKGGIVALTHALAASLAPKVRVNCISPGWIETSKWRKRSERRKPKLRAEDHAQHWAGRVGAPEDIAALALFLVSDESGFITGANFIADGGMTRKMIYCE
ncbi:MAG: SDR family oxidoreductase [Candidatus Sumerlaeota bacterium]|nr:SDR family oxidoreductase [Candidatus Sumerlaeota bacterium]